MRKIEYSNWLKNHVTDAVIANYISRCNRVERELNIDLDIEFAKDSGKCLIHKLTYTKEDQLYNSPVKCDILFTNKANVYNGMSSLRNAVNNYFEFCKANDRKIEFEDINVMEKSNRPGKNAIVTNMQNSDANVIDSYQIFLEHYKIDKNDFYNWGVSATIFPPVERVEGYWNDLKYRIFNNKTVYIRGYGRDARGTQLYKDLYKYLFENSNVEKDPTNNALPHRIIQKVTGMRRNMNIYNYQVSHIWGHTKNIFMFEAPWNICYTPKIIDPFTGHETQGVWPEEYQKLFISKAYELYKPFIEEYNDLIKKYDVEKRTKEFILTLQKNIPEKDYMQFIKDATNELTLISEYK